MCLFMTRSLLVDAVLHTSIRALAHQLIVVVHTEFRIKTIIIIIWNKFYNL